MLATTARSIGSIIGHGSRCAARLAVLRNHIGSDLTRTDVGRQLCTTTVRQCASSDVTSHYAEVNGTRIHYERKGRGSHPVLLLPGALGSTRTDFGPQLEKLSGEKYTVIAWDPRGYGKSIPPERDWPLHFFQRDANDAVALMKSLKMEQFSMLGWSDGGITGLVVAGQNPDMVRRLVVWGANAYVLKTDMEILKKIEDVNKWSEKMREPFIKVYGREYFQQHWSKWVQAYFNYLEKRNGDLCIEETKKVRCPTLIVHGQKDALVVQEHPDYIHANIPGSVLVNWPEAKHNLHLRYADDFNALVEDFLDQDQ